MKLKAEIVANELLDSLEAAGISSIANLKSIEFSSATSSLEYNNRIGLVCSSSMENAFKSKHFYLFAENILLYFSLTFIKMGERDKDTGFIQFSTKITKEEYFNLMLTNNIEYSYELIQRISKFALTYKW